MQEASESGLRGALHRHPLRIHLPISAERRDLLVARKVARVGFLERGLDLGDPRFVGGDGFAAGLGARKDVLRWVTSASRSRRLLISSSGRTVMAVDVAGPVAANGVPMTCDDHRVSRPQSSAAVAPTSDLVGRPGRVNRA